MNLGPLDIRWSEKHRQARAAHAQYLCLMPGGRGVLSPFRWMLWAGPLFVGWRTANHRTPTTRRPSR